MTRDKVLAMILKSDGYVSGESISRELGITRAAVNAAVKQIKELGYDIESSTRKGYRLLSSPDLMNLGEIMEGPEMSQSSILWIRPTHSSRRWPDRGLRRVPS